MQRSSVHWTLSVNNCSRLESQFAHSASCSQSSTQFPVILGGNLKSFAPSFLLDAFTVGNITVFSWKSNKVWSGFKVNVPVLSAICSHRQLWLSTPSTPLSHSCYCHRDGKDLERLLGPGFCLQQSYGPTLQGPPRAHSGGAVSEGWFPVAAQLGELQCKGNHIYLWGFSLLSWDPFPSSHLPFPHPLVVAFSKWSEQSTGYLFRLSINFLSLGSNF